MPTSLRYLLTSCLLLASLSTDAASWSASIERDRWGVPHIKGESDADAAFGLAFAQAEDTWGIIEASIPYYRGTAGRYFGPDAARSDYLVQWLGLWEDIGRGYDSDLPPSTREYVEAFAAGLNTYAQEHPNRVSLDVLPITGKDIVAAHMLRHIMFYGFEATIKELTGPTRAQPTAQGTVIRDGKPQGSNAIAVGPNRSSDGSTMLVINSHQPLTGPVAWYEAHLESDEGLNVMGGLFPGAPTIGVGFTANTAWGATVNKPDLIDVYVLEMNPDDDNQYALDGQWQDLESQEIELDVLIWGFIPWSVTETIYRSVHGPVMKTDHGVYAVRYAGMGELRQVEQWLAMNKAHDFETWRAAVALNHIQSFNFVYAGRDQDIYFVHNSEMPERLPGWDWQQYLPGDRSELIWENYLAFDLLPQVQNPPSGFILSTNQTPFAISDSGSNPTPNGHQATAGWQTRMTNRAVRGLELFANNEKISKETLLAIKHDNAYSEDYRGMAFLREVTALRDQNEQQQEAQTILKEWNRATDTANRGAALGVCILKAEWISESYGTTRPDPQQALDNCIDEVVAMRGTLTPTWGDVNKHGRDDTHLPIAGGPDTLRAAYSGEDHGDHQHITAGDGLYYFVRWDAQGQQEVLGVHQYGNHFDDPSHPHFQSQVNDFVNETLHEALFDAEKRQPFVERRYRVSSSY